MDIFDIRAVNIIHHHAWERHGRHWYTRGWRTLRRWRDRVTDWREARAAAQRERKENTRMQDTGSTTMAPVALGHLLLSKIDAESAAAIEAAVAEKIHAAVVERCLEGVRQEHEAELEQQRERTRDALAKHKRMVEDELEGELEKRLEAGRRELRDAFSERLDTLKDERDQARQERDRAESILVGMVKELCAGRRNYLYSGGSGLRTLDLLALNETLGRHKLRLRAAMTPSERIVSCRVTGNESRGRTVFTLEASSASEPEENENAGAQVEVSQESTVN